jgi:hypothetical protein
LGGVLPIIRVTKVALLSSLLSLMVGGCVGDLVDLTPQQQGSRDMGGANDLAPVGTDDGSTQPAADGGGGGGTPKFNPDIMDDLRAMGCLGGCHAPAVAQQPIMQDSTDPTVISQTYDNVKARAMNGENSPILTKLLATSTVTHGGGKPIPNTADARYVRLLAWINAGNPP